MSAKKPKNGRYHGIWKIFGRQLGDLKMVENYRRGYDNINWGKGTIDKEEKELSPGYKIIRFNSK